MSKSPRNVDFSQRAIDSRAAMSTDVDATNESYPEFAVRDARATPARGQGAVFGASCLEGSILFEDHAAPGREKAFSAPVARPFETFN